MTVSAAQRRVLEDVAAGGTGLQVSVTVVPVRCLLRDGYVTHEWGGLVLTDAGRVELAAGGDPEREPEPWEGDVLVDLDALVARWPS